MISFEAFPTSSGQSLVHIETTTCMNTRPSATKAVINHDGVVYVYYY